jgi:predicted transcriptional regulator
MPFAVKVDGAACPECGAEDMYRDLKEEPSLYKVGASCRSCQRDFGVIGRVFRSDVDHTDELDERAEALVRDRVG